MPSPLLAADISDFRRPGLIFRRRGWQTHSMSPIVGLRQGCNASPRIFRCVMKDVFGRSCGRRIMVDVLLLGRRDAAHREFHSGVRLCDLETAAPTVAGYLAKCRWIRVHRRDKTGQGSDPHPNARNCTACRESRRGFPQGVRLPCTDRRGSCSRFTGGGPHRLGSVACSQAIVVSPRTQWPEAPGGRDFAVPALAGLSLEHCADGAHEGGLGARIVSCSSFLHVSVLA